MPGILDIAMSGTSATLLARKWKVLCWSMLIMTRYGEFWIIQKPWLAVERIEWWRALGDNVIETIINKSDKIKELKGKGKRKDSLRKRKKELSEEEKEFKSKRKLVQEKLIKFATRILASHVPDGFSRKHASGCHYEIGARPSSHCDGFDR